MMQRSRLDFLGAKSLRAELAGPIGGPCRGPRTADLMAFWCCFDAFSADFRGVSTFWTPSRPDGRGRVVQAARPMLLTNRGPVVGGKVLAQKPLKATSPRTTLVPRDDAPRSPSSVSSMPSALKARSGCHSPQELPADAAAGFRQALDAEKRHGGGGALWKVDLRGVWVVSDGFFLLFFDAFC